MLGKAAMANGCKEAILDSGFRAALPKGKIYAFLKGVLEAGVNIPYGSKEIFPVEDRLLGKHLKDADSVKIAEKVELLKKKIMG